jgi:glucose/arabinose dehydrogenase
MPGVEEPTYFGYPMSRRQGYFFALATAFRITAEERLLTDRKMPVRDVRQGPDGAIYLLSSAGLLRLTPK